MRVICLGELIVDFVASEEGKPLEEVEIFQKNIGGAPANVAVGLHHHNVPVLLWSKVGDDSFGRFLKVRLRQIGLDTAGISTDETHPTKLAFVGIRQGGDRYFEFHNRNSAEQYITPQEVNIQELQSAGIFHFGGVALIGDITAQTTFYLLEKAREAGCLVSFDPNIRLDLCGNPQKLSARISQALKFVDILKLSLEEYNMIFPKLKPAEILRKGISLLIITQGSKGSRFFTHNLDLQIPAVRVRVADSTGAGDAFTAAVLTELLKYNELDISNLTNPEIQKIGNFAGLWASRIVSRRGAVTAYQKM